MIRETLTKLKAWFLPGVPSTAAKPVAKGKKQSSPAQAPIAEAAKRTKRRAQRQARARNR